MASSDKQAHLQMIEAVINRLSQNSFLLKGWSVVLLSALFSLAASQKNPWLVYLSIFPTLTFWGLDGYFLLQERLYRQLYEAVRQLPDDRIDYSMNASIHKKRFAWLKAVFSRTLIPFHGVVVLLILATIVIINEKGVLIWRLAGSSIAFITSLITGVLRKFGIWG